MTKNKKTQDSTLIMNYAMELLSSSNDRITLLQAVKQVKEAFALADIPKTNVAKKK